MMSQRTVNSARNPKWANYDQTIIDLEVDFDELDEVYVPFSANASDSEPHGVDLYNRAIAGEFGEIASFVRRPDITGEDALSALRSQRNAMLAETDYIEIPTKWATLSASQQTAWSEYRNALRDLPANYSNAEMHYSEDGETAEWVNLTWPTKPE